MSGVRGIDLARMPALAHSIEAPPIPADVFEVMRIAAGAPEDCQLAAQATGQPAAVLIEAARFYLQQVLLRPNADPYRILGLPPGASRELEQVRRTQEGLRRRSPLSRTCHPIILAIADRSAARSANG
jgi:hypothetical protein